MRALSSVRVGSVSVVVFLGAVAVGDANAQVWVAAPDARFTSQLVGRSETGGSVALPLVEESLKVDIDGQHATTRLRQVYHNASPERIEGATRCRGTGRPRVGLRVLERRAEDRRRGVRARRRRATSTSA